MSKELILQIAFAKTRPARVRPHPMGGGRISLRNWLLPAPTEFSGGIAPRTQVRLRHLA